MKNAVQGNSLIQGVSKVVVVLDPDSQEKKPDFEEDSSSVSIGKIINRSNTRATICTGCLSRKKMIRNSIQVL